MCIKQKSPLLSIPQVLIFKTNIQTPLEADSLCFALLSYPGIRRCTIDFEDCDKVLRIEGERLDGGFWVERAAKWGVCLEELPD